MEYLGVRYYGETRPVKDQTGGEDKQSWEKKETSF